VAPGFGGGAGGEPSSDQKSERSEAPDLRPLQGASEAQAAPSPEPAPTAPSASTTTATEPAPHAGGLKSQNTTALVIGVVILAELLSGALGVWILFGVRQSG